MFNVVHAITAGLSWGIAPGGSACTSFFLLMVFVSFWPDVIQEPHPRMLPLGCVPRKQRQSEGNERVRGPFEQAHGNQPCPSSQRHGRGDYMWDLKSALVRVSTPYILAGVRNVGFKIHGRKPMRGLSG